MDDQQGHVIDGTARARQWRRSKAKAGSAPDAPETRSDAPKSFAGSLLVPADMLPAAFKRDEHADRDEPSRATERPPRPGAVTADKVPVDDTARQNPFLAPEAAVVGSEGRTRRRAGRLPRRVSRPAGALITVAIALAGLFVALIDGTADTRRTSATSLAKPPVAIGGAVRAAITSLTLALTDVEDHTTPAHRVARQRRTHHARRHTTARSKEPMLAVSGAAPSGSAPPAYTSSAAISTRAPSTPATQPAAAPHNSPPPGPTGSDPLGGIGSCVKGC